jgi:hypothetical protein
MVRSMVQERSDDGAVRVISCFCLNDSVADVGVVGEVNVDVMTNGVKRDSEGSGSASVTGT